MKRRKIIYISVLLSVLLLLQLMPPSGNVDLHASADENEKMKILEIVAKTNDSSGLTRYLRDMFDVTTLPIKKFVSQRDELHGKYDIIVFSEGDYAVRGVNKKEHNTTSVMNDITELRVNEIIDYYINKGLPVVLPESSMTEHKTGKLYKQLYIPHKHKTNVIIYENVLDLWSYLYKFNGSKRPNMELTRQPDAIEPYKPGDVLSFSFKALKPTDLRSGELKALLYIDSDFNDRYDETEIVMEQQVTSAETSLAYKLPKGYSGIRNWKLEFVDELSTLKDYETGRIKYKDIQVDIKVLQVMPGSNSSSSLKEGKNMNQSYLNKPGEYSIDIEAVQMNQFNNNRHHHINGNKDMLIFGFGDSYNVNAKLSETAAESVEDFIDSKQSVMFTHDTVFMKNSSDHNVWVQKFKGPTGQLEPRTDLGLNAPNTSKNTAKVNDGLLTSYPNPLGDTISVATTHNQYFTLNLEDPEVTPWFNISGSSRDINDSYNHYYMYTKGNITYSGTGHTSTGFPAEEQRLFVNTMYRAFLGANHAPVITVNHPAENSIIPSNQDIMLQYKLEDFDLKDKLLDTKVFLNEKEVYSENGVPKDSVLDVALKHQLPNGGDAVIRIEATDKDNAKAEKTIEVKIVKLETNLEVIRTSNAAKPSKVGEPIEISYLVTPQDITGNAAKSIKTPTITVGSLFLRESFPAGLEVNLPSKTGTIGTGYRVEEKLPDIVYTRVGDKFVANPIKHKITVIPKEKKNYLLNESLLNYKDVNGQHIDASFNPLTFQADVPLDHIQFPASYVLNKESSKNFALDLLLEPQNAGIKEVKWSESSNGNVLKLNPATGTATAVSKGDTIITVTVTDVFGNVRTKQSLVTVRVPIKSFEAEDIVLNVGQVMALPIKVDPPEERNSLEIKLNDERIASIHKENFEIKGLEPGETIMTVSGVNENNEKITKTVKVTVNDILIENISVSPSPLYMNKGESKQLTAVIYPANATNKELIWESEDPTTAEVVKGLVTGKKTGMTIITVYDQKKRVNKSVNVYVGQPLTGISVPEELTIPKGKKKNIGMQYEPSDATNVETITYTTENRYYATVDKDGNVLGRRYGTVVIITKVTTEEGSSYTKRTTVRITDEAAGDRGTDLY